MASFVDEIGAAVKQTACAVIATNDAVNGFMEGIAFPGADSYRDVTRALRRQLCDNNDDVVPTPSAGFTGGQCDDWYTVRVEGTKTFKNGNESPFDVTVSAHGPIKSIAPENPNPTSFDLVLRASPPTELITLVGGGTNDTEAYQWSATLTRQPPTLPDDCGDPETPIPPYQPTTITQNITYINNEDVTINEDVDITIFAPQTNLIGGIFAPITIAGNTFQLAGTVNLSPKFDVQLSPIIDTGGRGGKPDEEPPSPDEEVPEPTENPEERRVIVGAVVTATSVSARQDFLPQGQNPDIAIPNLGYVAFYIAAYDTRSWTEDIPIKNVRSYIPCPAPVGAIDISATGRSGVEIHVEPVWAYPSQQL